MQKIQSLRAEQSRAEQLNDCVKVIGCMDHTLDHTFESANRVYDDNGIAPTVNTCGGGGLQPKVIEVNKVINRQIVAMRGRNPDNPTIQVRQATEQGFTNVEIGGCGRPELSIFSDTQRKGNREWSDKSNADNGEYP